MNHMEVEMMPAKLAARRSELITDAIASALLIIVAVGTFSLMCLIVIAPESVAAWVR